MNNFFIIGRVCKDAEVRETTTGTKVARFSIAYDSFSGDKKTTEFYDFTCFSKTADFAERFIKKGKRFAISGHLKKDAYEKQDGTKVNAVSLVADKIDFADGADFADAPTTSAPDFDVKESLPF